MNAPKYEIGSVIDLKFASNRLPDRIYVNMIYTKTRNGVWMYEVYSEANGKKIYLQECDIDKNKSNRTAKCYEHPIVSKMYENGYRFCGNYKSETAFSKAHNMKPANYIRHIILNDAVDPDGNLIDGYSGLWIQYNNVIPNSTDGYSVIK